MVIIRKFSTTAKKVKDAEDIYIRPCISSGQSHAWLITDGRGSLRSDEKYYCLLIGARKSPCVELDFTVGMVMVKYAILLRNSTAEEDFYERIGLVLLSQEGAELFVPQ
jgi:hypothetical protein